MSTDLRTRVDADQQPIEASVFFRERLPALLDEHRPLFVPATARIPLVDFCIEVDGEPWTLSCANDRVAISTGRRGQARVRLTRQEFSDIVNDQSGQLRVLAKSHRALIWPAPCIQPGLDLEVVDLPTRTGDITGHLTCTQHKSQAPVTNTRKVVYAGFGQVPADTARAASNRARIDSVRGKAHTSVSQDPGYVGDLGN